MKYLNFFIIAIFITSCCSAKEVIKEQKNEVVQVETEIEDEVEIEIEDQVEVEVEEAKQEVAVTQIPEPPKPPKLEEVTVIDHYETQEFNHSSWNTLLQKNVTVAGNVDYRAFKNNRSALKEYIDSLGENIPKESWDKEDKLAYWINAYNALTVDLIVRNYPVKSIKDIKDPWDQRLWKLGKKWYNLNEIEHDILRKMDEPRIHFAIVCASYSCPKLQNVAFTASQLEEQLTNATKEFLADKNRNEISPNSIKISKIFQWFSKDFKQDGDLIDFLNNYSEVQISSNAKKSYKDYNWDLNE